jgi:hypothetical protein
MATKQRLMTLVLAIIAIALTVTGLVIAATNTNPGSVTKDPLALKGYPPTSANLLVTVSTSGGLSLSANVSADFSTGRVEGTVQFPLESSSATIDLRLMNNRLFARSANVSSGPWLDTALSPPSLFGIALEMTKPDIDLITGFEKTVSTSGFSTTYVFYRQHVALASLLGSSASTSTLGSVRWTITTGSSGEVESSSLVVKSKRATTTLSATVLSYNQPVHVTIPTSIKPISASFLHQLLSSANFTSLLIPRDLTSLSQASLS